MSTQLNRPFFQIILLANHLKLPAFELALDVVAHFYKSLTAGRQRRIRLCVMDATTDGLLAVQKKLELGSSALPAILFDEAVNLIGLKAFHEENNLIFHPERHQSEAVRVALLSWHCPILTHPSWEKTYAFNAEAAVFLSAEWESQARQEYSRLLLMLYQDPGAFQMLKNRARRPGKYEWAQQSHQ